MKNHNKKLTVTQETIEKQVHTPQPKKDNTEKRNKKPVNNVSQKTTKTKVHTLQSDTVSNEMEVEDQGSKNTDITDEAKEKLNELDVINHSMKLVTNELEGLNEQFKDLNLKIKGLTLSLRTVNNIAKLDTGLIKNITELDTELIKKETALKEIENSLVKRFLSFFTGEKTKLKNEIATINTIKTTLNSYKIQTSSLEINECKNIIKKERKAYKKSSIEISKKITKKCGEFEKIEKKVARFENGLPKERDPFVEFRLRQFKDCLSHNKAVANDLTRSQNENKSIDPLTKNASNKAQHFHQIMILQGSSFDHKKLVNNVSQETTKTKVHTLQSDTVSNEMEAEDQGSKNKDITDEAKEKLNELDVIKNSMELVTRELEGLNEQFKDLNLKINDLTLSLHTVNNIAELDTGLRKNITELDTEWIKKETALKEIENSLVKRFLSFFTGEKTKLKTEIATINTIKTIKTIKTTLNSYKIQTSSLEINEYKSLIEKELEACKESSIEISKKITEKCGEFEKIEKKVASFENGLSKEVAPFVEIGLRQFKDCLSHNKAVANDLTRSQNEKKSIDPLTKNASNKAQHSHQTMSLQGSSFDQRSSRA